ncbi:MAG: hypothetical protein ACIAQU_04120 [Phycisphaerales bacterium JB064]
MPLFARSCVSLALVAGLAVPLASAQDEAQELPITAITLYRSGVGSFERVGPVKGDANVYLRVDQGQLNDLLKSLVVLDGGGGTVGAISYGSREPIERRLASFGVNLADNPSMSELLSRLRGAKVKVQTADSTASGTITSVETVQRAEGDSVVNSYAVTIFTGGGIKRIDLDNIINLEFLDKQLRDDIERALNILAQERDENIRTVEVSSTGEGEREMLVSYVHEMPVWKPAYRLVLSERGEPILQAWAIVENTTEEDWRQIDLSLVASQPVGFTMDLQTPLFAQRPDIPVPAGALAQPKIFAGTEAMRMEQQHMDREARARFAAPASEPASRTRSGQSSRGLSEVMGDTAVGFFDSAASMAAAIQVGESVVLRIENPIDLDRQQSAMIPVLTEKVKARKISIYTPSEGGQPMLGVELTNTSSAPLISGPVAVYDGAYAGDAMVGFVPRQAERMLAYAVDMDLKAQQAQTSSTSSSTYRITNGMLQISYVRTVTNTYTLRSEAAKKRTVVIEHQPMPGWDLIEPTNGEKSDDGKIRYERTVDAGKSVELKVVERRTERTSYGLIDADLPNLIEQVTRGGGQASDKLIEAMRKGAAMNRQIADLRASLERVQQQVSAIESDQARIRQNMQAIDKTTDLYRRYLDTLTQQEDRLNELRSQADQVRNALEKAEAERRKYFEDLSVQ